MSGYISDKMFNKIHRDMPIVYVDIVLKSADNGFLLVKRKEEPAKDKWWFVGGRVLKNESLETAAKRKVLEETCLITESIEKIVEGYELLFREDPFGHGAGTHAISTCFSAEVSDLSSLILDKYHSDFKLFNYVNNQWNTYLKHCLRLAGFKSNDSKM